MQMPQHTLPQSFVKKKAAILESLSQSYDTYKDKSPKGSVDAPIIDLITEINNIDGLVTTSSCSGRVAVFVEGPHSSSTGHAHLTEEESTYTGPDDTTQEVQTTQTQRTGPGGKGGGKWLFVSHDPISPANAQPDNHFTQLCGLQPELSYAGLNDKKQSPSTRVGGKPPRLIRLSFSPLILHILAADLAYHARPLLAAAINAGFRESGVQSLSALDPVSTRSAPKTRPDSDTHVSTGAGTMVGIRTAGLAFETIIGIVAYSMDDGGAVVETMQPLVDEGYLRLCFEVIRERFDWNETRKERLRAEIGKAFTRLGASLDWEDKEARRRRKREEGLEVRAEKQALKRRERQDSDAVGGIVDSESASQSLADVFEQSDQTGFTDQGVYLDMNALTM